MGWGEVGWDGAAYDRNEWDERMTEGPGRMGSGRVRVGRVGSGCVGSGEEPHLSRASCIVWLRFAEVRLSSSITPILIVLRGR